MRLSEAIKLFITQELACFSSPSAVSRRVEEAFGISISRQQVQLYDPDGCNGYKVADRWRQIHAETRRRFLDSVGDIAIANAAYRLKQLDRLHMAAFRKGDIRAAMRTLELAAREVGYVM